VTDRRSDTVMDDQPFGSALLLIFRTKSIWGGEGQFLEPLMRLTRGDLGDRIVSSGIDR
jgi:hypothetical protein